MNYRQRFKQDAKEVLDKKTPDINFDGQVMFNETPNKTPNFKFAIYVPVFTSVAALGVILGVALWPKSYDAINPPDYYKNIPAERSGEYASFRGETTSLDVYNNFVASFSPLVFSGDFDARSFSPVDAFVNVAILGYTSTGTSQSEILEALGVVSVEELNQVTKEVIDVLGSGAGYSLNSFWYDDALYDLRDNRDDLLEVLSNYYYTNVISRKPTSALINEWLDLYVPKDRFPIVPEVEIDDENTVAAIVSSYFAKNTWANENLSETFENQYNSQNHKMTFHGVSDKEVDFIEHGGYPLTGDNYRGVEMYLESMKINFFLPDVGKGPNDIFNSVLSSGYTSDTEINLAAHVPYFKIDNRLDLMTPLMEYGVNSVFNSHAAAGLINSDSLLVTAIEQFSTMSFDFGGVY
ncbi:MAG: serpin family protein, partial [Bacilli bacterium]|nr:serpin family protein [Bacilli bacterium]